MNINRNCRGVPSFRRVCTRLVQCLALAVVTAGASSTSFAFTGTDANTLINAYNTAFFRVNSGRGFYVANTTTSNKADFWKFANEIQMLTDAYDRTGSGTYLTMITQLCTGFTAHYGSNWSNNGFNDDIMWASMAFARAYKKTGNTSFRTTAKTNFDLCYARAWDTVAGGLWWTTGKTSKVSAVNFPGAIAAYNLFETLGDGSYRTKSQGIFDWGKAHLWNPATGQVFDSPTNLTPTSYNQGTFVGAANYLGDVASATLVANYSKNSMGSTSPTSGGFRLLPNYDDNNDLGGFNGICLRWTAKFMKDRGLQANYLAWMQANANAAFSVRRSDNLSWTKWHNPTPAGIMYSWGCSSSVVALQVVPAG